MSSTGLKPWLDRIKQLEVANIELRAELRLVKELTLNNYRDEKLTAPDLTFPGETFARRAHKSAGH